MSENNEGEVEDDIAKMVWGQSRKAPTNLAKEIKDQTVNEVF